MKLRFIAGLAVATALLVPFAVRAQDAKVTKKTTAPAICAVMGEVIPNVAKASGKTTYNGKTYYFCCPGCDTEFAKDKPKYAKLTELRTKKMTLEAELKSVDAELTKLSAKKEAKAEKPAPVGAVQCAVTGEEIASADKAFGKSEFNGKTYYFCCPGCKPKFDANPAKFAAEADARAAKH